MLSNVPDSFVACMIAAPSLRFDATGLAFLLAKRWSITSPGDVPRSEKDRSTRDRPTPSPMISPRTPSVAASLVPMSQECAKVLEMQDQVKKLHQELLRCEREIILRQGRERLRESERDETLYTQRMDLDKARQNERAQKEEHTRLQYLLQEHEKSLRCSRDSEQRLQQQLSICQQEGLRLADNICSPAASKHESGPAASQVSARTTEEAWQVNLKKLQHMLATNASLTPERNEPTCATPLKQALSSQYPASPKLTGKLQNIACRTRAPSLKIRARKHKQKATERNVMWIMERREGCGMEKRKSCADGYI